MIILLTETSIPFSAAFALASGLENTLPLAPDAGADARGAELASAPLGEEASEAGAAACGAAAGAETGAAVAVALKSAKAETSALFGTRIHNS